MSSYGISKVVTMFRGEQTKLTHTIPFELLNNDCWREIFNFFCTVDLVNLWQTNTCFRSLVEKYFGDELMTFHLDWIKGKFVLHVFGCGNPIDMNMAKYVRHLTINDRRFFWKSKNIQRICSYFGSLEILCIRLRPGRLLNEEKFYAIRGMLSKPKALEIIVNGTFAFQCIESYCSQLEDLSISGYTHSHDLRELMLITLPNLKNLTLNFKNEFWYAFSREEFLSFLERHKKLKALTASEDFLLILGETKVAEYLAREQKIEKLEIRCPEWLPPTGHKTLTKCLSFFDKLPELSISIRWVNSKMPAFPFKMLFLLLLDWGQVNDSALKLFLSTCTVEKIVFAATKIDWLDVDCLNFQFLGEITFLGDCDRSFQECFTGNVKTWLEKLNQHLIERHPHFLRQHRQFKVRLTHFYYNIFRKFNFQALKICQYHFCRFDSPFPR